MDFVFAGDRQISVNILKWLILKGYKPKALMVSHGASASHADELIDLANLSEDVVFKGKEFNSEHSFSRLKEINPDFIFGIHFPYIIPQRILELPKEGFLNLHPAYLPYNKGWHTPSWAILDGTPYGATLHFMSVALDEGDIIHQEKIVIAPEDTANSLYQKVLKLEEKVFIDAFPSLLNGSFSRHNQMGIGTSHKKADLASHQIIDLEGLQSGLSFINKLRALTTNDLQEAAYFERNGKKYAVQVSITEIK